MCWPKYVIGKGTSRFPDMIIIIIIVKNYYRNGRIRDRYADSDPDRFVADGQLSIVL